MLSMAEVILETLIIRLDGLSVVRIIRLNINPKRKFDEHFVYIYVTR